MRRLPVVVVFDSGLQVTTRNGVGPRVTNRELTVAEVDAHRPRCARFNSCLSEAVNLAGNRSQASWSCYGCPKPKA